jgi:hypothetical protein
VSTNDRDLECLGIQFSKGVSDKGRRADNVEGCNAENLAWIKYTSFLQHFHGDRNSTVDRVGNDTDECGWAVFGDAREKFSDDVGIRLEEIYLKLKVAG